MINDTHLGRWEAIIKFAIKNIYVLFIIFFLIVLPVGGLHAGKFYSTAQSLPFNRTQNIEKGQSFELSQGHIKSRIEHKLVNYLLGNMINQYLDFGSEDDTAKKSSQHLKIRFDEQQLFFINQANLNQLIIVIEDII